MKKTLFLILGIFLYGSLISQTKLPHTLSKAEKIYGLSKFWKEASYNFVYLNKIDKQRWESDYVTLIQKVQDTKNDYAYYRLLQKFCATLQDGHTNVWMPKSLRDNILNGEFGNYQLFLKNIEGKAIIIRTNFSKSKEIPVGTEIIAINGMPTKEYANLYVTPYISTSAKHIRENLSISELLKSPIGTFYDLKLRKPNNKVISLKVSTKKVIEKDIYPAIEQRKLMDYKSLKGRIAYVRLNSFEFSKIETLFKAKLPEIRKAKKLIIDLRHNGGGNSSIAINILKYLTNDDKLQESASSSRLHIPTFKAWGLAFNLKAKDTLQGSEENRKLLSQAYLTTKDSYFYKFPLGTTISNTIKKSERFVVSTVLLIGNNTASAAEDFLIAADNQQHMKKIGEPTYGSTGQPMFFKLPGGATARICTKKDTYPDGREFVGYGVQPDIYIKKTYKDYIENKDPALEKAITYLNE